MALVRLNFPTDESDLPSFSHPVLQECLEDLEITSDCWHGLRDSKEKYLLKESREPKKAYDARLMRSCYSNFFRDAIAAFAGVLSRYELNSPPDSLEKAIDNVDGQGNSLRAFLMKADGWVLRDAGCLLMADMPPAPLPGATLADTLDRRPHLTLIDRRNVLPGGERRLDQRQGWRGWSRASRCWWPLMATAPWSAATT